jgi:hypothetical protein
MPVSKSVSMPVSKSVSKSVCGFIRKSKVSKKLIQLAKLTVFNQRVKKYQNSRLDIDEKDYDHQCHAYQALVAGYEYFNAGGRMSEALKYFAYFQFCYQAHYTHALSNVRERALKNLQEASKNGDSEATQMLKSHQETNGRYILEGVNIKYSKVTEA